MQLDLHEKINLHGLYCIAGWTTLSAARYVHCVHTTCVTRVLVLHWCSSSGLAMYCTTATTVLIRIRARVERVATMYWVYCSHDTLVAQKVERTYNACSGLDGV
jgi:hypothetical protein